MKNIFENRIISFLIVAAVYVIAAAGGIILYDKLPFDYRINLLLSDIFATVIVFIFSAAFNNASVYDPYWSVQPVVILILFAAKYKTNTFGTLLLIAVCFWGIRLTLNWAYTFQNLLCQDWRYTLLKEKTKKFYPLVNFTGIHLVPTLVVYLCILPAVTAIYDGVMLKPLSLLFIAVSIFAVIIQMTADIQMQKYRKNKKYNPEKSSVFIRYGLWKHARHPNYFGEIMMWWGIALACVFTMMNNWYLITGAIVNTLLFCFISIPLAEQRQSRKEGFEEYKKQTRILI